MVFRGKGPIILTYFPLLPKWCLYWNFNILFELTLIGEKKSGKYKDIVRKKQLHLPYKIVKFVINSL